MPGASVKQAVETEDRDGDGERSTSAPGGAKRQRAIRGDREGGIDHDSSVAAAVLLGLK